MHSHRGTQVPTKGLGSRSLSLQMVMPVLASLQVVHGWPSWQTPPTRRGASLAKRQPNVATSGDVRGEGLDPASTPPVLVRKGDPLRRLGGSNLPAVTGS